MQNDTRQNKATLYATLKQAVLTLQYKPRADLDEVTLCERYSLSRTLLREVLVSLESPTSKTPALHS